MSLRAVVALGGTFDPIHAGHLAILEQVARVVGADEAWLIPTATPPHRRPAHASASDRLDMARVAAEGVPGLRVIDLEARRPGLSYTIDTLDELARQFPGTRIWFVLGADAAREVGTWYRAAELLQRAWLVVVNRSGVAPLGEAEAAALSLDPARTRLVTVASPPVSATEIRRRVASGESIAGLVPEAVARLIAERRLYLDGR